MNSTMKNIIAAVVSAVLLASGAWAFSTEGRISKLEAAWDRLERIEDKIDAVQEEQRKVRQDLRNAVVAPRATSPRITERNAP